MSGLYEVTVLIQDKTIAGEAVPPEGALEVRKYAALSEQHARESATLGLTETEEIVSVSAVLGEETKATKSWRNSHEGS